MSLADGLQVMPSPNALHATRAYSDGLRHGPRAPVRRVRRCFGCGLGHHLMDHRCRQRRLAGRTGLVIKQSLDTGLHEALLPAPHRRFGLARLADNFHGAASGCAQKHDLSARDMLLRTVPVRGDLFQPNPILRQKPELNPDLMCEDSHIATDLGIVRLRQNTRATCRCLDLADIHRYERHRVITEDVYDRDGHGIAPWFLIGMQNRRKIQIAVLPRPKALPFIFEDISARPPFLKLWRPDLAVR
jgi:hypothetical protein